MAKPLFDTPNLSTFYANNACQPHKINLKNKYKNSMGTFYDKHINTHGVTYVNMISKKND